MPLLDHFHRPYSDDLPWESVNTVWIVAVVAELNRTLPRDRFRAFANRHLGSQVEADVAEFESLTPASSANGGDATAVATDAPPATRTIAATFPDDISVRIADATNSRKLVAVIEFISPSNKKESHERKLFTAKCSAYLQKGIGLLLVDVVTNRLVNMHRELLQFLGQADSEVELSPIYCVSYRPLHRDDLNLIDCWEHNIEVGSELPTVLLPLMGSEPVTLDLEATYQTALEQSGIDLNGV